jgi:hypothetical protein
MSKKLMFAGEAHDSANQKIEAGKRPAVTFQFPRRTRYCICLGKITKIHANITSPTAWQSILLLGTLKALSELVIAALFKPTEGFSFRWAIPSADFIGRKN